MLYFNYVNGRLRSISTKHTRDGMNRNDMETLGQAQNVAEDASNLTGRLHLATDGGRGCWPRFDVIEAPKVGDEVSRSFNGDSYPAGKIVKVSNSLKRVETSDGTVFYRKRESAAWIANRTWSMIPGSVSERNPSF